MQCSMLFFIYISCIYMKVLFSCRRRILNYSEIVLCMRNYVVLMLNKVIYNGVMLNLIFEFIGIGNSID
jgi:hypothetical protein